MLERMALAATLITLLAPPTALAAAKRGCGEDRAALQAQVDAACPCESAASRSAYLRCVSDKLRDLSGCHKGPDGSPICRPVSRSCASAIRRASSQSACGDAGTVACCIPRQHDCTNDPKSADGKKEGTCSGTKIPCDGMADCVLPRCRQASSAARCQQIGGRVGNGKDCNTACAP
ncbi:MAG TPA: hypothetical protein VGK30_17220 [Candidatus Binatia bacterium]|jgi:hypothetical protein